MIVYLFYQIVISVFIQVRTWQLLNQKMIQKLEKGLTYPVFMDTVFKTATIGQIVGPYSDQGKMRMAKVLDFNTKVCKVRHILISAPKGDEAKMKSAQTKADSLMKH
jgi:peptidyl-prolyl cis-trans isomerase D